MDQFSDDDFVQTNNNAGVPTLEGAADGSGSIFSQIFSAASDGYGIYNKYTNANTATARAAAPPIVLNAQDSNRTILWVAIGAAVLAVVFFVLKRK